MNIFKIAIPLAAAICFAAVAPLAVSADSKTKRSSSSSSAKKKSSSSKKSAKSSKSSRKTKSKSKSSSRTAKKKQKSDRRTASADTSHSWIDDLPPVELPTMSGPAEEELLEPVAETELESDEGDEADAEPEEQPEP